MPRSNSVSGGRRLSRSAIWPNTVALPVCTINTCAVPLRTLVPMNTQLVRSARLAFGRDSARLLLHREGFAGEHGLVDKEVVGFEHNAIGRDQAARGEQHHIARHHLFGGQHLRLDHRAARWI